FAADQWLFYGKAGGGWVGKNNLTIANLTTGALLICGNFNGCTRNAGWLVGAGAEWAFAPNWSVKLEDDYLGLTNSTFFIPAKAPFLASDTFTSNNRNVQEFKVGVNYLFNWAAPSRY